MDLFLLIRVWSFIFRPQTLIIQLSCCSYDRISLKRTVCIPGIALTVKHLLYWHYWLKTPLTFTRVIQKLKIQNGWEGKGNHCFEDDNTVTSSILPLVSLWSLRSLQQCVYVLCECEVGVSNPNSTKCEVHSVVWLLNKKGEAPFEVHCQIVSVFDDDMNRQIVAKWRHEFNAGKNRHSWWTKTGKPSVIVDDLIQKVE